MKKRLWMLVLAVVWLFAAPARAEEVRGRVLNLLTEVYGYTEQESQAFTIEVDGTQARFYPASHPDWVYTATFDGEAMLESATPFSPTPAARGPYPGENTVREGMRRLREEWLPTWNDESRTKMNEWLKEWVVYANDTLRGGLQTGTISGQDAVREFLVSCYGELGLWPKAVKEWERELLSDLELPAPSARVAKPARGVKRWEAFKYGNPNMKDQLIRFVGEAPEELEQAFAAPAFEGWTLLCGAMYRMDVEEAPGRAWAGLAAFERDGRRWLVALQEGEGQWKLDSLGENSLYPERDFWIESGSRGTTYNFDIVYPISEVEKEWFTVSRDRIDDTFGLSCRIRSYTRRNMETGEGIVIEVPLPSENYSVTITTADGNQKEEKIPKKICDQMPLAALNDFPTTLEACREAEGFPLPQGYGYTNGVHLRAKKSTRSKDLGDYNGGTLVQVLGREPGDPYDWYRVRIGRAEGYMSSIYVSYDKDLLSSVYGYSPLPVGEAVEDIRLRGGTGWFAKTVEEVPKGTRMHILAQCGDWLHVMIPQGELGSIMDVNGTDGYVKEEEIKRVSLTRISTGE